MAKTSKSSSSTSIKKKTMDGLGNLVRMLPTGTVFAFQFLNPVLTNNGSCDVVNKYLSGALIAVCGLSCFFSTFTDSYTDSSGNTRYGIATCKGLWPSSSSVDTSKYRLRVGDFVHAFLCLAVFAVLSLLDSNTVKCFYHSFEKTEKALLMTLPPVIGTVASTVFAIFPQTRHGIGYPASGQSSDSAST
ncbi:hypothetical protein NMG60_11025223 [Bertholletia excelsa]